MTAALRALGLQFVRALLLGLSATVLAACAGAGNLEELAQDVISGTVTVPNGHDVQGTTLFLCPEGEGECIEQTVEETGTSAQFSFNDVAAGTYELNAIKAVDEASFLLGCHGDTNPEPGCTPGRISPPLQDADVDLTVVTFSLPPKPPSEGPPAQ